MRFFFCFWLIVSLSAISFAQTGGITGKVTALDTKAPLGKASVFLSNATFGTVTAEDGTFSLNNVKPGQYELVVSILGYENFSQSILVSSKPQQLVVEMMPKPIQMKEIIITTKTDWKKNYALFLKNFIGTSANAQQCKVINPQAVRLVYHKKTQALEASTDEFLVIENKALGYRVRFLVNQFESSTLTNVIRYQGQVLFEEMKGSSSQYKKWIKKRQEAYFGSNMHFFRSIINQNLEQQGFVIRRLERKPNPKRLPEELIRQKINLFSKNNNYDSLDYWNKIASEPKYFQNLYKEPLKIEDVVRRTDQPGLFALLFQDYLYVVYTRKHDDKVINDIYRPLTMENHPVSIIALYEKYALFDLNGVVVTPQSTLYEGDWAEDKIAELLPVDYTP
ncbi:MAG: carboxypeptidase-like regulatory domain-containing protein [Sphingobacteriaceae bacterium]|nr:MAG: carboxypeptidase-like regulatory domain-containing protein [Sphingobacteriaceae bacterium]